MKRALLLGLSLFLVMGCQSKNEKKGYELSRLALKELVKEEIENLEIKNALYHPLSEDSELNELVVFYYFYDEVGGIEDLDGYFLYAYHEDEDRYVATKGDRAEVFFYNATSSDSDNYISLDDVKINEMLKDL